MEIKLRTSSRNKTKPDNFTPAKYESYSLNREKALNKKLDACARTADLKIEAKHINDILELSAAAYEVFRIELEKYFEQHSTFKIIPNHQYDKEGLCLRTSYSVRNIKTSRQQYRVNMFHTTSKIEVNGQGMDKFKEHLEDIMNMMKNKGNYKQLNGELERNINKYKEANRVAGGQKNTNNDDIIQVHHNMRNTRKQEENVLSSTLDNLQVDLQVGFPRAIEHQDKELAGDDDDGNIQLNCRICKGPVDSETAIECSKCQTSLHYTCENILQNGNEDPESYVCKSCEILDEPPEMPDETIIYTNQNNDTEVTIGNTNTEVYTEGRHDNISNAQQDCRLDESITAVKQVAAMQEMKTTYEMEDGNKQTKPKQKRQAKPKDTTTIIQQLEDQLVRCKARIVMLEDTNRDYLNTINLLRSQAQLRDENTGNNQYNPRSHIRPDNEYHSLQKIECMLQSMKADMEMRDTKIQHQIEVGELKTKIQFLELHKEMGIRQQQNEIQHAMPQQRPTFIQHSEHPHHGTSQQGPTFIHQNEHIQRHDMSHQRPTVVQHNEGFQHSITQQRPAFVQHNEHFQQAVHQHIPAFVQHPPSSNVVQHWITPIQRSTNGQWIGKNVFPANAQNGLNYQSNRQQQGYNRNTQHGRHQMVQRNNGSVMDKTTFYTGQPIKKRHEETTENKLPKPTLIEENTTSRLASTKVYDYEIPKERGNSKNSNEHDLSYREHISLPTQSSSGEASHGPITTDCQQKSPSQKGVEAGGHKCVPGSPEMCEPYRADKTTKNADNKSIGRKSTSNKPNHFLEHGRSNNLKGRKSL